MLPCPHGFEIFDGLSVLPTSVSGLIPIYRLRLSHNMMLSTLFPSSRLGYTVHSPMWFTFKTVYIGLHLLILNWPEIISGGVSKRIGTIMRPRQTRASSSTLGLYHFSLHCSDIGVRTRIFGLRGQRTNQLFYTTIEFVEDEGFELSLSGSEPLVLPLHQSSICDKGAVGIYSCQKFINNR